MMLPFTVVSGTKHYDTEKKYTVIMIPVILIFLVRKLKSFFSYSEYGYVSEEIYELCNVKLQIKSLECAVLSYVF